MAAAALQRMENEWNLLICCTIVLIAKYTEYHLPSHIPYLEHTPCHKAGQPTSIWLPSSMQGTPPPPSSRHRRTEITLFDKYKYEISRLDWTQGRYTHWHMAGGNFCSKLVKFEEFSNSPQNSNVSLVFWWYMVKLANEAWWASKEDKKCTITVWREKTKTLPLYDRCSCSKF